MPMPITPQVPLSSRCRGTCMGIVLRARSSALAPSLTTYTCGLSASTSRIACRAPRNFIGCAVSAASRRPAILATFCADLAESSSRHCGATLI